MDDEAPNSWQAKMRVDDEGRNSWHAMWMTRLPTAGGPWAMAMRKAMAEADVGDDVFGDDPTAGAYTRSLFSSTSALCMG